MCLLYGTNVPMIIMDDLQTLDQHEHKFVTEFAAGLNQTRAYMVAYDVDDYSVAASAASRLAKTVKVRQAITRLLNERAMPQYEIIARIADQARGTVAHFINADGEVDLTTPQAIANMHLIRDVEVTEGTTKRGEHWRKTSIKLHDAQAALVHLGRAQSMFTDGVRVAVDNGGDSWRYNSDGTPKPQEYIDAVERAAQLVAGRVADAAAAAVREVAQGDDVSVALPSATGDDE
jgi:predicted XRE-type DNA-binding protein